MDPQLRKEELQLRLDQLPPGALPQTEQSLRQQIDDLTEEQAKAALDGPKTVDLVIYIGGERKIVGKATVLEGVIYSKINPDEPAGETVARLIEEGAIKALSVGIIPQRAYPVPEDGFDDEAMSSFWNRERLDKFLFIDGIDYVGLESKPTEVDPFQDKFPYGPK